MVTVWPCVAKSVVARCDVTVVVISLMIVGETETTVVSVTVVWVRNDIARKIRLVRNNGSTHALEIGSQGLHWRLTKDQFC